MTKDLHLEVDESLCYVAYSLTAKAKRARTGQKYGVDGPRGGITVSEI